MSNRKIYWLCQFAGWFGMVAIETINYTFFIVGKFQAYVFWFMFFSAVFGIVCTHVYRIFIRHYHFFQKNTFRIWLSAFVSTIILSTILSFANFVPEVYQSGSLFFKKIQIITVLGTIVNWMRYVGVWVIIYFMYKILEQKTIIQQEKLKLENLAKTTELELLKTQLNPHFLFNALNSIKALVIINPEQSRDAIVKLSELLRFTLQYGKELLIPIHDEIKEVKKYLELEQLRFGARLQVLYEIDENTLTQYIPPAMVLTLAENAVKHGVAKQMSDCLVTIKSSIVDSNFIVQVINTGMYASENSLGIGLKHISKRLEEVYRNKAHFFIEQQNNLVVTSIQTPLS